MENLIERLEPLYEKCKVGFAASALAAGIRSFFNGEEKAIVVKVERGSVGYNLSHIPYNKRPLMSDIDLGDLTSKADLTIPVDSLESLRSLLTGLPKETIIIKSENLNNYSIFFREYNINRC